MLTTTSPGAQRAEMTLDKYDPDPDQRLSRFLEDLADYVAETGPTGTRDHLLYVASIAVHRADHRSRS